MLQEFRDEFRFWIPKFNHPLGVNYKSTRRISLPDFEFEKSLQKLINENKIEEGIKIAEKELEKYSDTNFSKIKGLNLLGQVDELENYLERFITDLQKRISLKAI